MPSLKHCAMNGIDGLQYDGLHPEEKREETPARPALWSDKLVQEVIRLILEAYL